MLLLHLYDDDAMIVTTILIDSSRMH